MSALSIAYLDISPRQTGKTERLIRLAQEHLEVGRRVYFVTFDGLVQEIARRLPGATVLSDTDDQSSFGDESNAVWFYDEFDWLKSTNIRQNGYYATTARFLRTLGEASTENDLLLRLIELNGRQFTRHFWPFEMDDIVQEARLAHSEEEFRRLYLGDIYK
ncbi:hypothetical protein D3C77_177630 [compost metagenome]